MAEIFITGTDTGVGKTLVTAVFARWLKDRGVNVGVQKWVSTGNDKASDDIEFIEEAAGLGIEGRAGTPFAPYCFSMPASPHLAAAFDDRQVREEIIIQSFDLLRTRYDLLLVEGVGGVMVPLREGALLIDLVERLGLSALVVARSGLGTLNHTLLTVEALERRGIGVLAVVLNSVTPDEELIIEDNRRTLSRILDMPVLGPIPMSGDLDILDKAFGPVGEALLSML